MNLDKNSPLMPLYVQVLNALERRSKNNSDVQQIVSSVRNLLGIESNPNLDKVDKPTEKKEEGLAG